jgi:hypothetical protein
MITEIQAMILGWRRPEHKVPFFRATLGHRRGFERCTGRILASCPVKPTWERLFMYTIVMRQQQT